MNVKTTTCAECGAVINEDCSHIFRQIIMCDDCYERFTVECDNCHERIWRNDSEGDENYTLCYDCYQNHFVVCEACNRLVPVDDALYEDGEDYPFCQECFERVGNRSIKGYYYKPEPIFYGSGNLFYGVELELDKGGEDCYNAQQVLDVGNKYGNRIYCKHDGSLNDGFEIVSHPMTLEYHTKNMNWGEILEKAVELNYRSHNTSTCGLHIHCSRSAFGKNFEEQEQAIARVVYFVEKYWNELVKLSRRDIQSLNHWASKYATISDTTAETYKKAKDKRVGRYVAVNIENSETIECRLFRGTLRYKTFIATLQLVDEICSCAINMTDRNMENMSWSEFVSRISPAKAELIEYLKEKRLYVNEIRTEGVEE